MRGCDLAAPPDVRNAVTFLMAFTVLGENFLAFLSKCFFFPTPLLPRFLLFSIQCRLHIHRKGEISGEKAVFSQSLEELLTAAA